MIKWLWQLKWALVIAIFAGPVFAYFSYKSEQRIAHVLRDGTPFTAIVVGGIVERHRRGADEYKLELQWNDAGGAPRTATLDISSSYAREVFRGDYVMLDTAELRYLQSETDGPLIVAADAPQQIADRHMDMWFGIIAGIAGLVLSPIWFLVEHRLNKKQEDDIDAELARMRGQAQGFRAATKT
jgi:hypothetical protein